MILNEYLKSTLNIMSSKYVVLFNEVLTSGHVPDSWAIEKLRPYSKIKEIIQIQVIIGASLY